MGNSQYRVTLGSSSYINIVRLRFFIKRTNYCNNLIVPFNACVFNFHLQMRVRNRQAWSLLVQKGQRKQIVEYCVFNRYVKQKIAFFDRSVNGNARFKVRKFFAQFGTSLRLRFFLVLLLLFYFLLEYRTRTFTINLKFTCYKCVHSQFHILLLSPFDFPRLN